MRIKNPFKKQSLSSKVLMTEVKKYETIGKTPLIECKICLGEPAHMECNSTAIRLLCDALGEPAAIEWHEKWSTKFDKIMKGAVAELEDLVKTAVAEKNSQSSPSEAE